MRNIILIVFMILIVSWTQVDVTNEINNRGFGAKFETLEQADSWIAKQETKKSWGLPERWVREDKANIERCVKEAGVCITQVVVDHPEYELCIEWSDDITEPATGDITEIASGDTQRECLAYQTIPAVTHTEYRIKKDYVVTKTDITAEVQAEENAQLTCLQYKHAIKDYDLSQIVDADVDNISNINGVKVALEKMKQLLIHQIRMNKCLVRRLQ